MRHDPAGAAIVVMLRGLKLYGMAQAAGELMEQAAPAYDPAVPILSQLLEAKTAEREVRSVAYQIKPARFANQLIGMRQGVQHQGNALVIAHLTFQSAAQRGDPDRRTLHAA